jgi:malic enzyme
MHSFLELLALFRCHAFPTLFHAVLPVVAATTTMAMKAAKENLAENQQADCLPEGNHVPSEDRRNQHVPQAFDNKAKRDAYDCDEENDFDSFEKLILMHGLAPYCFPKFS